MPRKQCNLRHRTAVIVTLAPGALSGARSSEESSATLFPFQIITAFKNSISAVWVLSFSPTLWIR